MEIVYSFREEISHEFPISFDSRFESGNLNYAIKVSETHYLLFIKYDNNSIGHTQWYFFTVKSPARTIQFDIVNMVITSYT